MEEHNEVLDIDMKCVIVSEIVEQIEKVNKMIDMHLAANHRLGASQARQYVRHRQDMIQELQSVMATLHLKVEDTSDYIEQIDAQNQKTSNDIQVQKTELELVLAA